MRTGNWCDNPALADQALAFNPVRPYEFDGHTLAQGLQIAPDGQPSLHIYAPQSTRVEIEFREKRLPLQREADGFWQLPLEAGPGFYYIQLFFDGAQALSPLLPIGFGYSRPCNFIEIPGGPDFFHAKPVPHGSVTREYFHSNVTGRTESLLVYTPPGYGLRGESYPILYLQHGMGENETGWVHQGKVNFILDNLIAEGRAVPMIAVMCNGMVCLPGKQGEPVLNHTKFENMLLEEIIPFVEGRFHGNPGRDSRALAGLSMGSMQTSRIGFQHPEQFAWLGLFSGFMRDFLATDGSPYLSVFDGGAEAFNQRTHLFFRAMGRGDPFFPRFLEEDVFCAEKGIQCHRIEYEGTHDWNVWRNCARDFLPLLFRE